MTLPPDIIYLDHNATTPLDPAAIEAMTHAVNGDFGNPSSPYSLGLTVGRSNTLEQMERAADAIAGRVKEMKMKKLSSG
jgi:cysteine desulfurase